MSAAKAVMEARAAGIQLGVAGDDLVLKAAAPPPSTVLDLLSRHKAAIVLWLRPDLDPGDRRRAGNEEAVLAFRLASGERGRCATLPPRSARDQKEAILMRQWLELTDDLLIRKIDELERTDPQNNHPFDRFRSIRSDLSRMAWNSYSEALDCDSGTIAETGVSTFPMEESFAGQLLDALMESPRIDMRHDDFTLGYVPTNASQCTYLNTCNEYRELTPRSNALLSQFLSSNGPIMRQAVGHPFRVASTRQFHLVPRDVASARHLDCWPTAIRKVFLLPTGAGGRLGTTWFRQRDGKELTIQSDKPIWVIFENSVAWHAPICGELPRPTIEFDIVPAREAHLAPVNAGLGGWYPWFPTEASLQEGTRAALRRLYPEEPPTGWTGRLRRLMAPLLPK